ncbi:hypothetical protein BJX70DRAFT_399952 [Aspergillus crustosus]
MTEPTLQFAPRTNCPSPMSLRHRGLTRSATIAEGQSPPSAPQRRNSAISDTISEARNNLRSSTDELFFPRVARDRDADPRDEESHWHSAPLGLALLPAVAGIFFQNGSAFVTDVTLLALAAVFLNWSVRLPWEWYRSARTIRHRDGLYDPMQPPPELDSTISGTDQDADEDESSPDRKTGTITPDSGTAAVRELQIHELAALASCFIFPLIGTWILHTIRSNLSRPSEGLVSNYNLTIFLLAAEIRPFSHLLKMVQLRTLHLQRIISDSDAADADLEPSKLGSKLTDLVKRLDELESNLASRFDTQDDKENDPTRELTPQEQEYTYSLVSEAAAEYHRGFQSDIDALNRAVRRYEKRTAVSAYETKTRLHSLETKLRDALSLAAAAQRSTTQRSILRDLLTGIAESITTLVFLPVNVGVTLAVLPIHLAKKGALICRDLILRPGAGAGAGAGAGVSVGTSNGVSVSTGKRPTKSRKSPSTASLSGKSKSPQLQQQFRPPPTSLQQKRAKRATIIEE